MVEEVCLWRMLVQIPTSKVLLPCPAAWVPKNSCPLLCHVWAKYRGHVSLCVALVFRGRCKSFSIPHCPVGQSTLDGLIKSVLHVSGS